MEWAVGNVSLELRSDPGYVRTFESSLRVSSTEVVNLEKITWGIGAARKGVWALSSGAPNADSRGQKDHSARERKGAVGEGGGGPEVSSVPKRCEETVSKRRTCCHRVT